MQRLNHPFLVAAFIVFSLFRTDAHAEMTNRTAITFVPVSITAQRNYCLTDNLSTSQTSGSMIAISASDVVVDFNGWTLDGSAAGSSTTAYGIVTTSRRHVS